MLDKTPDGRSQLVRRILCATGTVALLGAGATALAVSASADPSPTVVYVTPDGFDHSGCGTSTANQCQTIQYGIDQASAGDTVMVSAGTYHESLSITKGITLQGAGAGSSIIDGTGVTPPANPQGLVAVGTTNGSTTIDGFTIENAFPSSNTAPFAISIVDLNPSDSITVSDNTILGTSADPNSATDGPIGVDSGDTAATTVVENNDISGVFQGVLMEGSTGSVDVTDNHLHGMITYTDGATVYPGEGVYILSDKENSATDQDVTDNTFDGYGGIGVAFSAGYDLGGCGVNPCSGSVSGTVTGNTFDLAANPATVAASAIRLRALNAGDALNLTMGGNSGTVAAPTKTIEQTPNAGSITITSNGSPDTIIPTPTPTLTLATPATVRVGAAASSLTGTATNPTGGDPIATARFDVSITGTSGITGSQLDLEYSTDGGTTFQPVTLSGTASAGNSITGYIGPVGGFAFAADGVANTVPLTLAVNDDDAPGGALRIGIALDEVSSGTGNPVINTLASTSSNTTIVATSSLTEAITPQPLTSAQDPVVNVAVHTAGNSSGGTVTIHATSFDVTGTVTNGHAVITLPKCISGTHTLTASYSGTSTSQSITSPFPITVGLATVTLSTSTSPSPITTVVAAKVTVTINTDANTPATTVTIKGTSVSVSAKVEAGQAVLTLPKLAAGSHSLTVSFSGSNTTKAASKTITVTVVKATSTMNYVLNPNPLHPTTTNGTMTVTVSAGGASVDGGTVSLDGAAHYGTATVKGGKAVIKLPRAKAGLHSWKLTYSGTAAAAPATKNTPITVASK